jgi:heat shock protein HslJ
MKRTSVLVLSALCLGLAIAAYVGLKTQAVAVETVLAGHWQVTTLGGLALPDQASVTFDFAAPSVSGSAGCNRFTGTYGQDGSNVTFGPAALTRMACAPEVMDVEAGFTKALSRITRFDIAADRLQFYIGASLVMQAQRG